MATRTLGDKKVLVTLEMLAQKMDDNQAINTQKMDELSKDIKEHCQKDDDRFEHIQESLDGCNEDPGLRGRLDRIEQQMKGNNLQGLQNRVEAVEQQLKGNNLPELAHFKSKTIGIWIGATGILTLVGGVFGLVKMFG